MALAGLALTGLGAGVGAILRRGWTRRLAQAFVLAVTVTAGVAPMAWGDVGALIGLLDAGLGFLIGYVIYLGVRRVWEPAPPYDSPSSGAGPASPGSDSTES